MLAVVFLFSGCERGERHALEPEVSLQSAMTVDQRQELQDAASEFASEFEAGISNRDLDPDRKLMIVVKEEGADPAARNGRTSSRDVGLFRAQAGGVDVRQDLGYADAGPEARQSVRQTLSEFGLSPQWEGEALPVLAVHIPPEADLEGLAEELALNPNLDYMHANRGSGEPAAGPMGTNLTDNKHDIHNVQTAWDDSRGSGATIWVLDSGLAHDGSLNPHHDGEWEGTYGIDPKGYVDDYSGSCNQDGDCTPRDDHGHGTAMAGVIGENDNDTLKVGIAPKATVVSAKIAQDCTFTQGCGDNADDYRIEGDDFNAALDDIAALPDGEVIVSMSFVGDWSPAIEDAIADLRDEEGVIVIASTGNDQDQCDKEPANIYQTMSVGGISPDTTNYGCDDTQNVSALAGDSGSGRPQTLGEKWCGSGFCSPDGYHYTGGTSAAAAIAAGIAGLVWSEHPTWSGLKVEAELHDHAWFGAHDVLDAGAVLTAH